MTRHTIWFGPLIIGLSAFAIGAPDKGEDSAVDEKMPAEPLVCTLSDPALQERRTELHESLWPSIQRVEAVENGYTVEFPGDRARDVFDFVMVERGCCRFMRFDIACEPNDGPVTLTITGPEGTQEFLRTMFETPR